MKTILCFLVLILFTYNQAICQCFTQIDSIAARSLEDRLHQNVSRNYGGINPIVRLALHRVTKTDGSGGLTWTEINDWTNTLPYYFEVFNICFTVISKDDVADDTYCPFSSLISGPVVDLSLENRVENAINIYFLGITGTGGGAAIGGWLTRGEPTKLPSVLIARERVSDLSQSQLNTGVLAHEIGHVLGLYHTHESVLHGVENIQRTGSGVNCTTTGDLLCGTPADPGLNFSYTLVDDAPNCTYIGGGSLGGYSYMPDARNVMSYSLTQCLNHFSADQGARMLDLLQTTSYLDDQVVPWNETITANLPTLSGSSFYYSVQNDLTVSEDESTTFTVNSGTVTLEAVHKVVLQPGFTAYSGSSVLVRLGEFPCNSPSTVNSAKTDEMISLPQGENTTLDYTALDNLDIRVYPNPSNEYLYMVSNVDANFNGIEIRDLLGIRHVSIAGYFLANEVRAVDVGNLAPGAYIVTFGLGRDRIKSTIFIKQ